MLKEKWDSWKARGKEIKGYLKGRFIEVGNPYRPKLDWLGEEKYFGATYKASRKKRNKQAYKSLKLNSMRRRGKW
jgi:hypothetical protein